jgi:hypothetical protein
MDGEANHEQRAARHALPMVRLLLLAGRTSRVAALVAVLGAGAQHALTNRRHSNAEQILFERRSIYFRVSPVYRQQPTLACVATSVAVVIVRSLHAERRAQQQNALSSIAGAPAKQARASA